MNVDFVDETGQITQEQTELITKLIHFAAELEEVKQDAELSITFVTNEQIQSINRDYRHKDQPTDVISFALEERVEGEMEIRGDQLPLHLGDIIISVEQAREQANDYNHSFEREIGFLAVHGFLHLLGYDHQTVEEEKEMFERQENILKEFGLKRDGKKEG